MPRKVTSATLQLIAGNPNKRNKQELKKRAETEAKLKPPSDNIAPPKWLKAAEKKEFERIVKELEGTELLSNVDCDLLAAYCNAYIEYQRCTKIIEAEGFMVSHTNKAGETNSVPHPLFTKKKAMFEQMKAVAIEYGLTPAARAKMALKKEETKEPTELEKMFGDV